MTLLPTTPNLVFNLVIWIELKQVKQLLLEEY